MMNVEIKPGKLSGRVGAIASKSHAHRLILCAALADAPTVIACDGMSQDIRATLDCVAALGAEVAVSDGEICLSPIVRKPERVVLPCNESGSTLRFLLPVAAALYGEAVFTGAGRLGQRPNGPLLEQLAAHGAVIEQGTDPLFVVHGGLTPGAFCLPGDVSSQFVSGLLFALPGLAGDSILRVTPPVESAGYIDMTLDALAAFGGEIGVRDDWVFVVPGGQTLRSPGRIGAEGDWSNAAFWLAATAMGSNVHCDGLRTQSKQPDRAVVDLLAAIGAGDATLDMSQTPDLVPILAVAAAAGQGVVRLTNAARLRIKESDRLAAVAGNLRALGGEVEEGVDELIIHGTGGLRGGRVSGHNDHRMVMSCAIAATICRESVIIEGAGAADKSYPGFWADYVALGGDVRVL